MMRAEIAEEPEVVGFFEHPDYYSIWDARFVAVIPGSEEVHVQVNPESVVARVEFEEPLRSYLMKGREVEQDTLVRFRAEMHHHGDRIEHLTVCSKNPHGGWTDERPVLRWGIVDPTGRFEDDV